MQRALAELLARRLGPGVWWTMVDAFGPFRPWIVALRRARGIRSGVPDLLLLHRGRLTAIEMKTSAGRLTESQKTMRPELLAAGARWFCCYSVEAVLQVLKRLRVPLQADPRGAAAVRKWKRRLGLPGGEEPYAFDPLNPLHHPVEDPAVPRPSRRQLLAREQRKAEARNRTRRLRARARRRAARTVRAQPRLEQRNTEAASGQPGPPAAA
ncbi:MAG: VRR-NUC domain-containing protein [Rhodospirillales bacterium]|nr:VRR-NUC domain-containing protein [Rhodospirillales bacterium]